MVISIPATRANLGAGFDSLGLALSLYTRCTIKPSRVMSIQIRGEGANNPKLYRDNVFVKIFYEHYRKCGGNKKDQFRFQFDNQIPVSRGLGSSSAVIVGAVSAAYFMTQKAFIPDDVLFHALKYEHHPDNITPACVGGFTVSAIAGKHVCFLKAPIPSDLRAVVVVPTRSISTAYSRQSLPKRYAQKDVVFNLSRASLLTAAFFSQNWNLLREASKDKMHQNMRMQQLPTLFDVQRTALKEGALMSTLSGSGSSFFNLCAYDDAPRIHKRLEAQFPSFQILCLEFDNQGVQKQNGMD